MQINTVFQRYEKKYLLKGSQYEQVRNTIEPYMQVDEFGKSTICNIYYDTTQYDLVTRSIEKPVYKEKLRLRSYGTVTSEETVFLEIKKKYNGIVYKRRIPLTLKEADESFLEGRIVGKQKDSQIAKELNYFLERYQPVPSTYLAYDRIAMYGKDEESIRITFDFHIRSRQERMDLTEDSEGELLLPEDYVVMEIKVTDAYPFWLVHMLEELKITPVSFSKYGTVYQTQIFPNLFPVQAEKKPQETNEKQKTVRHPFSNMGRKHRYARKEEAYV